MEMENRLFAVATNSTSNTINGYRNRFMVKRGQQLFSLHVSEIVFFYSKEKVTFVRTTDNREFVVPFTIEQVSRMICPAAFFRVSRKHVISHHAIGRVLLWFNGKIKLEIKAAVTEEVIISRDRVPDFRVWMGE